MPTDRRLRLEPLEARDVPTFFGNHLFPADNPWNQVVSAAPVAANSDAIIGRIVARHGGTAPRVHPDFGNPATDGALYGIPVNVVDGTVARVPVQVPTFGYPGESDLPAGSDTAWVPIPAGAVVEGDGPTGPSHPSGRGDSHLLVYDKTANVLHELFCAVRPTETVYPYGGDHPTGRWGAYQYSFWDLNTNHFRTIGATSADAAGLPILPGLVRPDETLPVASGGQGAITHAIRMTVQQTRNLFTYPASHQASWRTDADLPRMGERFRLKATYDISGLSPEAWAIAQAMKTYGLIVADNGSDLFFTGTPSTQWNMDAVRQIKRIRASDLEVVNLTPVVAGLSVASGSAAGGTAVTISGRNFGGAAGHLSVLFGATEASAVTVLSDSQVVVTAPAGTGVVDVRVRSGRTTTNLDGAAVFFGYGLSLATPAAQYTFTTAVAPTVSGVAVNPSDATAQRSRVTSLAVTFGGAVSIADGAFTLTRQADGAAIASGGTAPQVAVAVATVDGRSVATLTFSGAGGRVDAGSLADGVWVLRVDRTKITAGGVPMAADYLTPATGAGRLFRLFGDGTGDGAVDFDDLNLFGGAFGTAAGGPGYRPAFDANLDGAIDFDDLNAFGGRFGVNV